MPKVNLLSSMNTRSNIGYIQERYKGEAFEKSFFPNTLKLWNNLPKDIQRNKDLLDFKTKSKQKTAKAYAILILKVVNIFS